MKTFLLSLSLLITLNIFSSNNKNEDFLILHTQEKDLNSDFYKLYNFIKDFYKKWNIQHEMNVEVSLKVSKKLISNKRYLIAIQPRYLNIPEQIDELVSILSNKDIRDQAKLCLENQENLYIGTELINKKRRFKVYYEDVVNAAAKSFEWEEDAPSKVLKRSYKAVKNYQNYLNKILSKSQLQAFGKIKKFLNLDFLVALKKTPTKESLCFKFKPNVKVEDVKDLIINLTSQINKNSKEIVEILNRIKDVNVYWLVLEKDEVNIYARVIDWRNDYAW